MALSKKRRPKLTKLSILLLDTGWGWFSHELDMCRVLHLIVQSARFVGLHLGPESALVGNVVDAPVQTLGVGVAVGSSDGSATVSLLAAVVVVARVVVRVVTEAVGLGHGLEYNG